VRRAARVRPREQRSRSTLRAAPRAWLRRGTRAPLQRRRTLPATEKRLPYDAGGVEGRHKKRSPVPGRCRRHAHLAAHTLDCCQLVAAAAAAACAERAPLPQLLPQWRLRRLSSRSRAFPSTAACTGRRPWPSSRRRACASPSRCGRAACAAVVAAASARRRWRSPRGRLGGGSHAFCAALAARGAALRPPRPFAAVARRAAAATCSVTCGWRDTPPGRRRLQLSHADAELPSCACGFCGAAAVLSCVASAPASASACSPSPTRCPATPWWASRRCC
jgi:hypothetical protein